MSVVRLCLLGLLLASAAPAVQDRKPSHDAVARELVKVMGLTAPDKAKIEASVNAQVLANPELTLYREVLLEWAQRTLTPAELEAPMADLYADTFTEAELRQMLTFFRTDTGRKYARSVGDLLARERLIGEEIGKGHAPELTKAIEERKAQQAGARK